MALASLLLGLLSANLASGQGRWAFYGSFSLLGVALTLCLRTRLLVTSVGVVISLRSATVLPYATTGHGGNVDVARRSGGGDQNPASAGGLRALHVPDLAYCHGRACGAAYDRIGHLAGSFSTLTLDFFLGKFNRKEGVFMDNRTPPNRPRLSLPILGLASVLGVGLGVAIAVALHNPGAGTAIGTTLFVVGIAISLARRGR